MDLFCLAALPNKGEMRVGPMQTCWGQNFCHACNIMELFHAIDLLTCQPSIIWNSFQAITHLTNLPCYYLLYIPGYYRVVYSMLCHGSVKLLFRVDS